MRYVNAFSCEAPGLVKTRSSAAIPTKPAANQADIFLDLPKFPKFALRQRALPQGPFPAIGHRSGRPNTPRRLAMARSHTSPRASAVEAHIVSCAIVALGRRGDGP